MEQMVGSASRGGGVVCGEFTKKPTPRTPWGQEGEHELIGRAVRGWSAFQPGLRVKWEWVGRNDAARRRVSRDGFECCCKVLQGVREGGLLLGGERQELEAAAGHAVRPAP